MEDSALLDLWEAGCHLQGLDRALLMLWGTGAAHPGEDPAGLPIGERDLRLLRVRARRFGTRCEATADCPACRERLAFPLDLDVLAAAMPPPDTDAIVRCSSGRYRLPTSRDVAAALGQPDPRRALARRCRVQGEAALDDAALAELDAAFAAADPAALVDVSLQCQGCAHAFTATFDIAQTLWDDLARDARRTLDEVHLLALAYGWSEAQVLAVPPARRRHYLGRVRG